MKMTVKMTAVLINPDGTWEDQMAADVPDATFTNAIITRTLGAIVGLGGLVRELGTGHSQFIPMCRVKDLDIQVSAVSLADNLDLAKATAAANASKSLIQL